MLPKSQNNPTSGCDPTPRRLSDNTREAFAACDPAFTKELTAIQNTPTELLLQGLSPFDKTIPRSRGFRLDEAVTDLKNILDAVDPPTLALGSKTTRLTLRQDLYWLPPSRQ